MDKQPIIVTKYNYTYVESVTGAHMIIPAGTKIQDATGFIATWDHLVEGNPVVSGDYSFAVNLGDSSFRGWVCLKEDAMAIFGGAMLDADTKEQLDIWGSIGDAFRQNGGIALTPNQLGVPSHAMKKPETPPWVAAILSVAGAQNHQVVERVRGVSIMSILAAMQHEDFPGEE